MLRPRFLGREAKGTDVHGQAARGGTDLAASSIDDKARLSYAAMEQLGWQGSSSPLTADMYSRHLNAGYRKDTCGYWEMCNRSDDRDGCLGGPRTGRKIRAAFAPCLRVASSSNQDATLAVVRRGSGGVGAGAAGVQLR